MIASANSMDDDEIPESGIKRQKIVYVQTQIIEYCSFFDFFFQLR